MGTADLFVDLQQFVTQCPKPMILRDRALGGAQGNWGGEGLGDRRAVHLKGQAVERFVAGIAVIEPAR